METGALVQTSYSKILDYAARVMAAAAENLVSPTDLYGGHFLVLERKFGSTVLLTRFGHFPEDNLNDIPRHRQLMRSRIEQTERAAWGLFNSGIRLTSHFVSERNRRDNIRAGVVMGNSLIFGLRCFPDEFLDEAVMLVLVIRLHQWRESEILEMISEEHNPHLRPLLEACHWTE